MGPPYAAPMGLIDPGTPERGSLGVRIAFERHHTRPAEAVGRAPGRVNLLGEHTDYNGGLCLPIALPHSTYVAAARRSDRRIRITSEQALTPWHGDLGTAGPGGVTDWPAYVAGVVWAMAQDGVPLSGLDLSVDSTLPLGAGLASSAALSCATALALTRLAGLSLDEDLRTRLVGVCVRAETEVAGAPTGGLDQEVSLFARAGHAMLLDFGSSGRLTGEHVRLPFDDDGLALLVTDTRVSHTHTDGGFAARRADCEAAASTLGLHHLSEARLPDLANVEDPLHRRRAHHVVTENQRVRDAVLALRAGDYRTLGRLLAEGHASLRDDLEVSCPELDTAVAAALDAGALGARMTGGGFGGASFALVERSRSDEVAAAIDVAFLAAGHRTPQHLLAHPSSGGEAC